MSIAVSGISGGPVKNSNTDRLVKAGMYASGLKSEFVKLNLIDVKPWGVFQRFPNTGNKVRIFII